MSVTRRALALALAATLAGSARAQVADAGGGGSGAPPRELRLRPFADPASVIAAEIAFNRLAREKGQWTAFRATAAEGAVMFAPARVDARAWLNKRADPPVSVKWQPYAAWLSCDGAYAVTRGAWQRPESVGWFVTVWQRQPKDGGYKWVLDIGDARASPLDPPEMIDGKVADCPAPARGPPAARGDRRAAAKLAPLADPASAQAPDGSLRWRAAIGANGAGTVVVELRKDGAYREVVRERVAPQG